jgi:hypothetical protein
LSATLQKLELSSALSLDRTAIERSWHRVPSRKTFEAIIFDDSLNEQQCGCFEAVLFENDRVRQISIVRLVPSEAEGLREAADIVNAVTPPVYEHRSVSGPEWSQSFRWSLPAGSPAHQIGVDADITRCGSLSRLSVNVSLLGRTGSSAPERKESKTEGQREPAN